MKDSSIRKPAVAGAFYPADPALLRKEIHRYLEAAHPPAMPDHVIGLLSPHAGYVYSGGTAAYGYKLLVGGKYKRAIVFALSHQVSFRGGSIFTGEGYSTPLGVVPVDRGLVEKIRQASSFITYSPLADQEEHSLEVQLPFLQEVLGSFLLVPVLIRDQTLSTCQKVVDAILKVFPEEEKKDTVIIGSTDLYHGPSSRECQTRDHLLAETVKEFDERKLEDLIDRGEIMACGPASIMATMLLSRAFGAKSIDILHVTNSSEVMGHESDYVVGYLSAVLY